MAVSSPELPQFFEAPGYSGILEAAVAVERGTVESDTHIEWLRWGDTDFIVRTPGIPLGLEDGEPSPAEQLRHRIDALHIGMGNLSLEQIVGYDVRDEDRPVAVTFAAPGSGLRDLTHRQVDALAEPHFDQLADGVQEALKKNLVGDVADPNNYMFDPESGRITILDYSRRSADDAPATVATEICGMLWSVGNQIEGRPFIHRKAWLGAIQRGLAVLERRNPQFMTELSGWLGGKMANAEQLLGFKD